MVRQIFKWMFNNKLLILFATTSFCLFVSTLALSIQNKNLKRSINIQEINQGKLHRKTLDQNITSLPEGIKLSKYIKPTNYILQLRPDIKQKSFQGNVLISLHVLRATRSISLHTKNLNIHKVGLKNSDNKNLSVISTNILTAAELLLINLEEDIESNKFYELDIIFSGRLDKGIVGFYASTMKNGDVLKRIYRFKSFDTLNAMANINEVKYSERLSWFVRPLHYQLLLYPNLKTGLFQGIVKIDINLKEEKNFICLHSKFLDITDVKVCRDTVQIPVTKFLELKSLEQLLIQFDNNLNPGNYHLNIKFNGNLTRSIVGIYLSCLKNNSTMVASKFQPTYARQAFPCFDEPEYKATYDITLVKPVDYIALSNMNEISKKLDSSTNTETVTFATSVPMSTYLACFVICNFDYKENEINANGVGNNFKLRSFAQKDQTHKIDFSQDIGKRVTEFYIKYYEVPFPLPKLDMIAIPDYVSGATEHWGLITYRETSFLIDKATASSRNKISVANTVAHELAHMWFGNLVTMKWWDEVWLNEGFASYMQVKSLNAIEPSWTMLDQFLTRTLHSVLVIDAKLSSHPIVQTVETPDQITAIFDSISYNKGASVLRMLEGFIGEENFRKGVSDYLKKYEFENTITKDLLSSLEPYFKKNNPELNLMYIMDTWTKQMGYPLLTVQPGDQTNTYVVTQKRFLIDPEAENEQDSDYKYRWFVPVTYTTNKGPKENILWFPDNFERILITLEEGEKWLKINNNQVGYYRVNYTDSVWQHLTEQLATKTGEVRVSTDEEQTKYLESKMN